MKPKSSRTCKDLIQKFLTVFFFHSYFIVTCCVVAVSLRLEGCFMSPCYFWF